MYPLMEYETEGETKSLKGILSAGYDDIPNI
jgi:hypothetical protein